MVHRVPALEPAQLLSAISFSSCNRGSGAILASRLRIRLERRFARGGLCGADFKLLPGSALGAPTPLQGADYRFDSEGVVLTSLGPAPAHKTGGLAAAGPVQHEVWEGERAAAFVDGANGGILVSCRPSAPHVRANPYGVIPRQQRR